MNFASQILNFNNDLADEARYTPGASSAIALNFQTAGTTDNALRNGAADNVMLAAKWTQARETDVKHVYLRLKRSGTIATGKFVQVRIVEDDDGSPGALTHGISARVLCTDITTSYALVHFTFPLPVALESDTYHIILEGDYEASSSNHIKWRSATVASGGNREVYDTSWVTTTTETLEVHATIPVIYQAPFDDSQFSDVRYDNASPSALCRTADVSDAVKNDTLAIYDPDADVWTSYKILKVKPDGSGLTTLELSAKAAP